MRLPLEAFPEVSPPFIFVSLPYTGSTPEEIERTITAAGRGSAVDDDRHQAHGLQRARRRRAVLHPVHDWSKDVAIAASEARESIDAIRDDLPDDLQRYFVLKFSTTDEPMLRVRLAAGNGVDLSNALRPDRPRVQAPLERIAGVAKVRSLRAPCRTRSRSRSTRIA